jgi:hypothetical protein
MVRIKIPEPPVADGELWRCGRHVYACSDLMKDDVMARVLTGAPPWPSGQPAPVPTLIYTDPPWGQGLANSFRTKAGLGRAEYRWTDIYRSIANMSQLLGIGAWFEGPSMDRPDGMRIPGTLMTCSGYRRYLPITYMGGNPAGLYYASPDVEPPDFELSDNAGFAAVGEVLSHYEPGVLLDPCCGLGGIPLVAEMLGWSSVNNELNPKRMARALSRMAVVTREVPERIA